MAADVYSVPPHTGRGGWTWYILGFKRGETLEIDPCIPGKWTDFTKNPEGVNTGVKKVIVDGKVCDDGKVH